MLCQKFLEKPDQCAIGAILAGWRGKRQHGLVLEGFSVFQA